ncbi:ABC transporter substrate-binding protein [Celeribacter baekdonensis]|uniref:ABC transporter substrate-binding protein n=1 Tax=Celeribacter baekdonensis TaxID=875171 RepID=A0A2R4LXW0_9RHOB|nr:ABC transporter substrate-binding protein [Celeribacter baekdonensis]AVW89737.1 ABC transporter substrate-binding protein [Celeribacter baekdonensis]
MTFRPTRRAALLGGACAVAGTLTGFSTRPAFAAGRPLKIGVVSPKTGPMAAFAEPTEFVMSRILAATGGVIENGGVTYPLEIVERDTQSNPNRAAEVTQDLILSEGVDVVLCYGGPENANPASDQCELNGVPCLASDLPIEPWFFGRNGDPAVGFDYTYCAFFDVATYAGAMLAFMDKIAPGGTVGGLWPNDADGVVLSQAFTDGFGAKGYSIVDPGRFDLPTSSFSTQIAKFRDSGVDIVQGIMPPPDFTLFWTQCAQQGFQPKAVIAGKSSEYPASVQPLGEKAVGVSVPIWWTPDFPYISSLDGTSAFDTARRYELETGRQWTAGVGSRHAMFEVLINTLRRATDLDDPDSVRDALAATKLDTICGLIDFSNGPVPNSAKLGLVSVQWVNAPEDYQFPYDMAVVENSFHPTVPVSRAPFPIPYN